MAKRRVKLAVIIILLLAAEWGMKLFNPAMTALAIGQLETRQTNSVGVTVQIKQYDILNVLVPASYSVAFNPYGLDIRTGTAETSARQVLSRNYGIVNKSIRDKLVTVILTLEDLNGEEIVFVDSVDEALDAEEGTFAVYLALVPADKNEIMVDNRVIDKDITSEELSKISMGKAEGSSVTLKEGTNQVTFKLSRAEYRSEDSGETEEDAAGTGEDCPKLSSLAADGMGVTGFTFVGAMNPKADWAKLNQGIKISIAYRYENTTGRESIVEGTGALVDDTLLMQ